MGFVDASAPCRRLDDPRNSSGAPGPPRRLPRSPDVTNCGKSKYEVPKKFLREPAGCCRIQRTFEGSRGSSTVFLGRVSRPTEEKGPPFHVHRPLFDFFIALEAPLLSWSPKVALVGDPTVAPGGATWPGARARGAVRRRPVCEDVAGGRRRREHKDRSSGR
ncbi:hypothetical protein QR680_013011 [Steinernema hermaphroditum]|uniref:Uncharacterized protein n=1 Tax=Steinernema hermaphroditum TaxID=289476 RepID=A0AA39M1S9_9BILA|nr:hypothetical protein QR680_013011 [Steinernema hermaphroditum]